MRKSLVSALVVVAVCAALVACDKELKPNKPGVFLVDNNKLVDWPAVSMDDEVTTEGFILPFFTGDVDRLVRYPSTYMIFNGDYKVQGVKPFAKRNGRWEEDGAMMTDAIQTQQFKGEKLMYKVKLTRELKPGIYVVESQVGARKAHFAFRVP